MSACSLALLGGFDLCATGGGPLSLTTRKDRLLLAHLALTSGRPVPRDKLAGMLWADRGDAQARDSLRQSIAAIRQAFRRCNLDPITGDRETVTFDPSGIDIDAVRFAALVADGSRLDEAAMLYRGSLLEGVDGGVAGFDVWLTPERERLRALAVHLTERIAETGRASAAGADLARRLLSRDPACEPACRALMRLYVGSGERHAALKAYAACRDALKQELGVEPELGTASLYRDILTTAPGQVVAPDPGKTPDRPSIAVLPFSNLSADHDLDHLCEGLAEDIITGLGRFGLLFVIDRYSSSEVAKQTDDLVVIGARLGVALLVRGSLQRQGDRVRITVRLLDAASRSQVWGEAYDHPLADLANIPDSITRALVSTLHARVESALIEHGRRKPKVAAYDCLLRGVRHLRGYGPDDNARAIALFQQALDLDPDYALAWAYRGFADVVANNYDDAPDAVLENAEKMALRAVQMDEHNGRCFWLLGLIVGYRGNLKDEVRYFEHALRLNPNDANAMATLGAVTATLGHISEGLDLVRQAMRLNPYHPEWYWVTVGQIFYRARRYEDALEAFRHRADPGAWVGSRIAACYAQLGRMDEARAAAAEVCRMRPGFSIRSLRHLGWSEQDVEHLRDGMRKAGLPD